VAETRDLQTWTQLETVLISDEGDLPEFDAMPVFGMGNLFLGLLYVFNGLVGTIEIGLVFSPDGRQWNHVPPRELFLSRAHPSEFDYGMVPPASAPVIAHGEMRI
jgi:hypothetical protein